MSSSPLALPRSTQPDAPSSDPAGEAFVRWRRTASAEDLARAFDATAPKLLAMARALGGSGSDAEDLVQSTFLRAMTKARSFHAGRPLLPWLLRILSNEGRMILRGRMRSERREQAVAATEGVSDRAPELLEATRLVRRAIERLPEHEREVLERRLLGGYEARSIAEQLGIPAATVRSRTKRGLDRMRAALPPSLGWAIAALLQGQGLANVRRTVLASASLRPRAFTLGSLAPVLWGLAVLGLILGAWLGVEESFGRAPRAPSMDRAYAETEALPRGAPRGESELIDLRTAVFSPRNPSARTPEGEVRAQPWMLHGTIEGEFVAAAAPRVRLTVWRGGAEQELHHAEANSAGHFEFDLQFLRRWPSVPRSNASLFLEVVNRDAPPIEAALVDAIPLDPEEGFTPRVRLTVQDGPYLHGRVIDERGHGVGEAKVAVAGSAGSAVELTEEDGSFRIAWAAETSHLLVSSGPKGRARVALPPARGAGGLDLGNIPLDPGCVWSGVLRDRNGAPRGAVPIWLQADSRDSAPRHAVTEPDGSFCFAQLSEGSWHYTLGPHRNLADGTVQVSAAGLQRDLTLRRPLLLLDLRGPNDWALPGLELQLAPLDRAQGASRIIERAGVGGVYVQVLDGPGSYALQIHARGAKSQHTVLTIPPGTAVFEHRITLEPAPRGVAIEIDLRGPSGPVSAPWNLALWPEGQDPHQFEPVQQYHGDAAGQRVVVPRGRYLALTQLSQPRTLSELILGGQSGSLEVVAGAAQRWTVQFPERALIICPPPLEVESASSTAAPALYLRPVDRLHELEAAPAQRQRLRWEGKQDWRPPSGARSVALVRHPSRSRPARWVGIEAGPAGAYEVFFVAEDGAYRSELELRPGSIVELARP